MGGGFNLGHKRSRRLMPVQITPVFHSSLANKPNNPHLVHKSQKPFTSCKDLAKTSWDHSITIFPLINQRKTATERQKKSTEKQPKGRQKASKGISQVWRGIKEMHWSIESLHKASIEALHKHTKHWSEHSPAEHSPVEHSPLILVHS